MAYWLFKSEPETWGWDDQVKKGAPEEWNGVRNYQARNNMRAMKKGELGFFYHSVKQKAVVGIVRVANEIHPDSTTDDPRWECVDIEAVKPFERPRDARRDQDRSRTRSHGPGQQFAPFGSAGECGRMEGDLQAGRRHALSVYAHGKRAQNRATAAI